MIIIILGIILIEQKPLEIFLAITFRNLQTKPFHPIHQQQLNSRRKHNIVRNLYFKYNPRNPPTSSFKFAVEWVTTATNQSIAGAGPLSINQNRNKIYPVFFRNLLQVCILRKCACRFQHFSPKFFLVLLENSYL